MDSYLALARKVLRDVRQPLSAREVLKSAYQSQIVPPDLYDQTQDKTLQARLATDILKRHSKSEFYRTGPGRFFLRSLQHDNSTPDQYRREYFAPVRAAQLGKFDVLVAPRVEIEKIAKSSASRFAIADLGRIQWRYQLLDNVKSGDWRCASARGFHFRSRAR